MKACSSLFAESFVKCPRQKAEMGVGNVAVPLLSLREPSIVPTGCNVPRDLYEALGCGARTHLTVTPPDPCSPSLTSLFSLQETRTWIKTVFTRGLTLSPVLGGWRWQMMTTAGKNPGGKNTLTCAFQRPDVPVHTGLPAPPFS